MDGRDEVRARGARAGRDRQAVRGRRASGGWDIRAARHALAAVLRRRPEAYHDDAARPRGQGAAAGGRPAAEDGARRLDPRPRHGQGGGPRGPLHYDDHERRSGLVRFLDPDVTPEASRDGRRGASWATSATASGRWTTSRPARSRCRATAPSLGQPLAGRQDDPPRRRAAGPGADRRARDPPPRHRAHRDAPGRRAVAAPAGRRRQPVGLVRRPRRAASAHDGTGQAAGVEAIGYGNDWVGVAVEARPEPAADAWWSPIETVSNSESGFERVYQGSALLLSLARQPRARRDPPVRA